FLHPMYSKLKLSKDPQFAAIAEKGVKESAYHLRHSSQWIVRLANGTEESRRRLEKAIEDLWTYTGDMFEHSAEEDELAKNGVIPMFTEVQAAWKQKVTEVFGEAGIEVPKDVPMASGGRKGIHSEYLGHMISEMQYLPRAYPDAKW
ncbi:MAG: 1,2-phenylacetyl-CoA epoxidase subunit PaaC, partial [Vicingaceae bacterium]